MWPPGRHHAPGYPALERAAGIRFHHPVGALIVARPSEDAGVDDPPRRAREDGVPHDLYQPGAKAWQAQFPHLDFPDSHYVIHEPAPAGYINPRKLIEAQNVVAAANGAVIIREMATAVRSRSGCVIVTTESDSEVRAARALVAAGAFTNFNDLLPVKLPLTLETEVIALGRVDRAVAEQLQRMPTVKYMIDDPVLEGIYVVPPVRYTDGGHYIKLGANTSSDRNLDSSAEVQAWFRQGDSDVCLRDLEAALRAMWPSTEFLSVEAKQCIVCRTPGGDPIIDQVDEAIFVATGGNGAGAKGSDVWGELAAGLVHDGRWPDGVPRFTA